MFKFTSLSALVHQNLILGGHNTRYYRRVPQSVTTWRFRFSYAAAYHPALSITGLTLLHIFPCLTHHLSFFGLGRTAFILPHSTASKSNLLQKWPYQHHHLLKALLNCPPNQSIYYLPSPTPTNGWLFINYLFLFFLIIFWHIPSVSTGGSMYRQSKNLTFFERRYPRIAKLCLQPEF